MGQRHSQLHLSNLALKEDITSPCMLSWPLHLWGSLVNKGVFQVHMSEGATFLHYSTFKRASSITSLTISSHLGYTESWWLPPLHPTTLQSYQCYDSISMKSEDRERALNVKFSLSSFHTNLNMVIRIPNDLLPWWYRHGYSIISLPGSDCYTP